MNPSRPSWGETPSAEVVQVLRVTFKRGTGVDDDPVRVVYSYFDFEGNLVAEFDPELARLIAQEYARIGT